MVAVILTSLRSWNTDYMMFLSMISALQNCFRLSKFHTNSSILMFCCTCQRTENWENLLVVKLHFCKCGCTCGSPLFLALDETLLGSACSIRPYSSQCSLSSAQAYPSLRDQSTPISRASSRSLDTQTPAVKLYKTCAFLATRLHDDGVLRDWKCKPLKSASKFLKAISM